VKAQFNVALTGSVSGLARPLAEALCDDPRCGRVLVVDAEPSVPEHPKAAFDALDLTQPSVDERVARSLRRGAVDVVIHGSCSDAPDRAQALAHELETAGTANLLRACARANVRRLVLASHSFLYGAHADNPQLLDETRPLRAPADLPFFADKVGMEALFARHAEEHPGASVLVLRLCPVVGEGTDGLLGRMLGRFLVPAIAGFNPPIQLIHQGDAVRAIALLVGSGAEGVFNVAGKGVMPLLTAIHLLGGVPVVIPSPVFSALGGALFSFHVTSVPREMAPYLMFPFLVDGRKAREAAGFSARLSIREVLEEFYRTQLRRHFA